MKTYITIFTVFAGFTAFSQQLEKCCESAPLTVEIKTNQPDLPEIDNYDGTYQIQVSVNDAFGFTDQFLANIQSQRKQDEDVILDYGNGRTVLILSSDKINDPAFVPFSSPYVFK